MLTDDDVVTRLRASFRTSTASAVPSPDLLAHIHLEHRRSRRRQQLLAPAGAAVLGLGASGVVATWPSEQPGRADRLAGEPSPSPPALVAGPTVKLFDYDFQLPGGFVITSVKHVDLAKQQPPQPVAGDVAFLTARDGDRSLDLSVYRGPIADAQASVQPPNPGSLRMGSVAGFPSKTYAYAAGGPKCITKENGRTLVEVDATGPCTREGSETRVASGAHELVLVMAEDVPAAVVDAVLASGLSQTAQ